MQPVAVVSTVRTTCRLNQDYIQARAVSRSQGGGAGRASAVGEGVVLK